MDWAWAAHVAWRELLHVMAGFAVVPGLQVVWTECRRAGFLPKLTGLAFAAVPVVAVLGLVALREPGDVAAGDPAYKSIIDYAGWSVGMLAYVYWSIRYRFRNRLWTSNAVVQLGPKWAGRLGFHEDPKEMQRAVDAGVRY